jgi:hypothetical protein
MKRRREPDMANPLVALFPEVRRAHLYPELNVLALGRLACTCRVFAEDLSKSPSSYNWLPLNLRRLVDDHTHRGMRRALQYLYQEILRPMAYFSPPTCGKGFPVHPCFLHGSDGRGNNVHEICLYTNPRGIRASCEKRVRLLFDIQGQLFSEQRLYTMPANLAKAKAIVTKIVEKANKNNNKPQTLYSPE